MTRLERQQKFADSLHDWLEANVGPLTVCEVSGIMSMQIARMQIIAFEEEEAEEDDAEGWKSSE